MPHDGREAVLAAYDFVRDSYQLMAQRLDAVHHRIETLETLALTLTIAVPVVAGSVLKGPSAIAFDSPWLYGAVVTFVVILVTGLAAQWWSGLKLLSPLAIYDDDWLELPEAQFKENVLFWAGEHWRHNTRMISRKGTAATAMTFLFVVEVLLFIGWFRDLTN